MTQYRRVAQLNTAAKFRDYLASLNIDLPFDETLESGPDAPLAQAHSTRNFTMSNRFCVLPMEGWDGTEDGHPSELTFRRWERFGLSGAKLIWGGEAVAVRHEGRANPHQLMINADTLADLVTLRERLVAAHTAHYDAVEDLVIGLQLTHSGRFSRPDLGEGLKSRIAYRHPLLDPKFGITDDSAIMTDDELDELIGDFIQAAKLARQAGFDFVDVKHCHGYLGHELLSAIDRPGKYGGSFENRTRFLRDITAGIRAAVPDLAIGVRLSAFDWIPFQPGDDQIGEPVEYPGDYPYAFGGAPNGTGIDLTEPRQFLDLL
ncbi:MAG: NADH:flavin oxidoreductase, partial [Anaerolineae bacterium]|nr:NADH:flavin oxidoreductase [Anaerolineae bacterium]